MVKSNKLLYFMIASLFCVVIVSSTVLAQKMTEEAEKVEEAGGVISLELNDADINSVLKLLKERSKLNIIADSPLSGRVTIFLKDVPLLEAIGLVLKINNYTYQKVDNTILISTPEKLSNFITTEIIPLKYANVKDLSDTIKSFLPAAGNLQIDPGRNILIVTSSPNVIEKIKKLLKDLDRPIPQVMLEAKIMEVSSDTVEKYGIKWNESISASYSVTSSSSQADISLIVATLNLLEQKGKAKTLANPRIATLNNQTANILIGDRVPYTVTTYSAQGVAQVTVNFVETGIKLNITPHITEGGFITTRIKPEISSYSWKGDIPQVKTREVESIIRVKDGETIILGGLKNSEEKETTYRVPILGYIPLLGLLFTYKYKETVEKEIIVTITPHILTAE